MAIEKMVTFQKITEENFDAIIHMERPVGETFVATNAYSLAQAWLYRDAGDVYPFAICHDGTPVGFMMLDEDLEERCLVVWRILISAAHIGNGYGTAALRQIMRLARQSGQYDCLLLDCDPANKRAWHVYEKLGFYDTGTVENGEHLLRLDLDAGTKNGAAPNGCGLPGQGCAIEVRQIDDPQEKMSLARGILEALPEWFGIPEAREEYIAKSAAQPTFGAFADGVPIGFLCLEQTGDATMELYVMGVQKPWHRRGVGSRLFAAAKAFAQAKGYAFLQVKTVQMGRYPEYDATNRFYRSLGFRAFEVFPTLWDACNPCQVYVMAL